MSSNFHSLETILFLDGCFRRRSVHRCTYDAISSDYERQFNKALSKSSFYEYLDKFRELDAEFQGRTEKNGKFIYQTIESDSGKRGISIYTYADKEAPLPALRRIVGELRKDSAVTLLKILNEEQRFGSVDSLNIWTRLFLNKMLADETVDLNAVSFYENLDLMAENLDSFEKILDAIMSKKPITFQYNRGEHKTVRMHPYKLKNYNQRWYVIGKRYNELVCEEFPDEYYGPLAIMQINEIATDPQTNTSSVERWEVPFIAPDEEELNDYFYDTVGVTLTKEGAQNVYLRFSKFRYERYVATKPIAPSQKLVKEGQPHYDPERPTVKLKVHLNKELRQQILSFGRDCEVIEPETLRSEIAKEINEMHEYYGKHDTRD